VYERTYSRANVQTSFNLFDDDLVVVAVAIESIKSTIKSTTTRRGAED
jgi:hypothetical protein